MFSLPIDIYFEIAAFVVAVFCYGRIKDRPLKWIILYLLFIVVVELIGYSHRIKNSWLYICTIPVEYFFYSFIFYSEYQNRSFRKLARCLLFIIPIAAIVNVAVLHGVYGIDRNKLIAAILIAGSSIMIVLCCLYFIDLFQRDEETNLLRNPVFWISVGIFFFNLGELPYNLFFDYILHHRYDQRGKLFISMHKILNYVLYTFISIGLICSKKQVQKT